MIKFVVADIRSTPAKYYNTTSNCWVEDMRDASLLHQLTARELISGFGNTVRAKLFPVMLDR